MANYIIYDNQGATRNQPLNDDLIKRLAYLQDMGITMKVFSGGQPGIDEGGARVGSVRHDHGGAADAFFYKDGRQLDWANKDDLPVFEEIVRQGKANGITGFGAGPGYMQPGSMHIGGGKPGVWGAGGKGDNAPEWLRAAYNGAKFDPVAEVVAAASSPTPSVNTASSTAQPSATSATPETTTKSKGLLNLNVAEKGLLGIKGDKPNSIAKALFPDSLLGGRVESGGKLLGSVGELMTKQNDTSNQQTQQAAQAGMNRRAQAQPVQPQLTQSVVMPSNGIGTMASSAPTGVSPTVPTLAGNMDPELVRKMMMLQMKQGNFGRTA